MNTFYLQKEAEVGTVETPYYIWLLTLPIAKIAVKNVDRQEEAYPVQERDNLEDLCDVHYPARRL